MWKSEVNDELTRIGIIDWFLLNLFILISGIWYHFYLHKCVKYTYLGFLYLHKEWHMQMIVTWWCLVVMISWLMLCYTRDRGPWWRDYCDYPASFPPVLSVMMVSMLMCWHMCLLHSVNIFHILAGRTAGHGQSWCEHTGMPVMCASIVACVSEGEREEGDTIQHGDWIPSVRLHFPSANICPVCEQREIIETTNLIIHSRFLCVAGK